MDDILSAALSTDNAIRRRAEATLSYLRTQRGFPVALAKRLSRTAAGGGGGDATTDDPGGQIGSLAGVLLQHFVADLWEVADHSVLPREDKAQVSCSPSSGLVLGHTRGPKQQQHAHKIKARVPPSPRGGGGRETVVSRCGLDFFRPEHTKTKTPTLVPSPLRSLCVGLAGQASQKTCSQICETRNTFINMSPSSPLARRKINIVKPCWQGGLVGARVCVGLGKRKPCAVGSVVP